MQNEPCHCPIEGDSKHTMQDSLIDYVANTVPKIAADDFGHLVANPVNLSFSNGLFPSSFKVGQVMLLLKNTRARTENVSNYWPNTSHKIIDNIPDRLTVEKMRRHVENSPNFGPLQSTYRALHSNETVVTMAVDDLRQPSKSPFVLLSLDIIAAFDTLEHHRLLERAKDLFSNVSTIGLGPRAATIRHRHYTGRQPHLHVWYTVPPNSPTSNNCTRASIRPHKPDWRHSPHVLMQSLDSMSETTFSTRPRQKLSSLVPVNILQNLNSRSELRSAVWRFRSARHFGSLK